MKIELYTTFVGILFVLVIGFIVFSETNKKYTKRLNIRYKNIDFTKKPNKEEWEALNKNISEMTRKELRICERFYNASDNPKMKENIKEERERRNMNNGFQKWANVMVVGETTIKSKKKLDFITHKAHKKEFAKQRRKQERQTDNK